MAVIMNVNVYCMTTSGTGLFFLTFFSGNVLSKLYEIISEQQHCDIYCQTAKKNPLLCLTKSITV